MVRGRIYYMQCHTLTFQFLRGAKRFSIALSSTYKKRQQRSLARSCEKIYNMQHNTLTFLSCNVRAKVHLVIIISHGAGPT